MKRNNIKYGWRTVGLIFSLLLSGCVKDSLEERSGISDGEMVNAVFTLSPDFVEVIEVRSVSGVDEKVIKDLWVIQLKADGTGQLQAPQYITTGLTSSSSDYKVTIPLLRQASKIYFIANTHNASAYTGKTTSELVEAVTMTVTGEENLASADGIPMSGIWTGTPDLLGITGRVSLSRAIAKVNFNLNASLPAREVFTLKSIIVKQVPNTLNYCRDAAKLGVYPYPVTPTVMNYPEITYNETLSTTSKSLWWYLPENARGTGDATTQIDKGLKFPAGQAAYCTYLEVKGMYEAGNGTYETIYKIYLGANNYNDYNVKRNTVYNVNTTIKGIDAADTRINSTDISIIVGLFGGWNEAEKEYTKLLEVQCVEAVNDPEYKWANAEETTNATNFHYGVTNIDALKGLSPDLSAYPAAKYCADKGNGWYLPSLNQLIAVWIASNAMPADFSFGKKDYWNSMENAVKNSSFVNFNNGYTYFESKTESKLVRCVRDITLSAISSKVINENNRVVIDNRDMPSRAITTQFKAVSTQATNSTAAPTNSTSDIASAESNKTVSRYFEVAKNELNTDINWKNAIDECVGIANDGNGTWRLPTQRELMLIWTLQETIKVKSLDFTAFSTDFYWSATEINATKSWYTDFRNGSSYVVPKTNTLGYKVRCIRDLIPLSK